MCKNNIPDYSVLSEATKKAEKYLNDLGLKTSQIPFENHIVPFKEGSTNKGLKKGQKTIVELIQQQTNG